MARRPAKASLPVTHSELSRDVYGFTVRPHHLQRYKEYAVIYKEEEAERSASWEHFLTTYGESAPSSEKDVSADTEFATVGTEQKEQIVNEDVVRPVRTGDGAKWESGGSKKFETWGQIRPSLWPVERALRSRFKKSSLASANGGAGAAVLSAIEVEPAKAESPNRYAAEGSGDESEEEFYDVERSDGVQDGAHGSSELLNEGTVSPEHEEESCPWKEELDALVRGGVPMALRGELWQVFVGTRTRRVQGHYQALLTLLADGGGDSDGIGGLFSGTSTNYSLSESGILEKWTSQIEKDLPRTFPGHPALDEDGRNALRLLLTAYARHNPDVGYCQAMNFFAALLLLMMPDENAFWTLAGIIEEYFEGYYSEKMLESQVDQLILEDLVRQHFPKLVNHLDTLGVQVAWVSGPWFLSIFVNILPWESVLRVWDVLLYEGNRSILFQTALALIELHGSEIMATKDAGDAVTTLQTLACSSFDSSQLVLIACMGYQSVNESKLEALGLKYRPQVLAALSERTIEQSIWHGANGSVSSTLYNHDKSKNASSQESDAFLDNAKASISSVCEDGSFLPRGDLPNGTLDEQENSAADLVEQVKWLKVELSQALEESRAATVRAEELESAFMELVKEDNRRLLSAKVETLEAEVAQLRQALADKEEQETAMVQVMLRMEQEQRLTEDARRYAEEDAAAQQKATSLLQAKYEDAVISLVEMEKRTVMAESTLEATLQYQALDNDKAAPSKQGINATREEELSRWPWPPRISPKPVDSDGSSAGLAGSFISPKLDGGDLIKEQPKSKSLDPQLVDPPQRQGVLSRRFSLSWLEKSKGKIGTLNTRMVSSPSQQGLEHDSSLSSVSLSSQNSLDSSQIPSLCQEESRGNTDTSTV